MIGNMKDNCENVFQAFLQQKFKEALAKNPRLKVAGLARAIGMSREHLRDLLFGKKPREPRVATCAKLAKHFHMSLQDFVYATGLVSPESAVDESSTSLAVEDSAEYATRVFLANVPPEMQNLCQELCHLMMKYWRTQDRKLSEKEETGK